MMMTPNQKKLIVSAMRLLGKSGAGDCKKRPSADCSAAGKIGSKKRWANWRAAELERQGWTRAAADGLAKDGLAKEGGKEPRGKMKLELTRLAAFAKVAQSKGELKQ